MDSENNLSKLKNDEIIRPEGTKFQLFDLLKPLIPFLSVIGGSLNGPISNVIACEGIFLKQVWRFTALNILFIAAYFMK